MERPISQTDALPPDGFPSMHGIKAEFVSDCIRFGAPSFNGAITLSALNEWVGINHGRLRKQMKLQDERLSAVEPSHPDYARLSFVRALRVYRDYYIEKCSNQTRLSWKRWRKSAVDAFSAIHEWEETEDPDHLLHNHKPFTTILEDSVWCALKSVEMARIPNPEQRQDIKREISRLSHFSIVSSAMALEAAANCLISDLSVRGQTAAEIEQLSTLGKFDVYLLARRQQTTLDRGHPIVQAVADLVFIRNRIAHPKVYIRQEFKTIGTAYNYETPRSKVLDIPMDRWLLELNAIHARLAIVALLDFLNFYLLSLCALSQVEVRNILFDHAEVPDEKTRFYLYSASSEFIALIREWNLDVSFLLTVDYRK